MRTTNPKLTGVWNQLRHDFTALQNRAHSRTELESLSDRMLRDIGLPHGGRRACVKPFWIA